MKTTQELWAEFRKRAKTMLKTIKPWKIKEKNTGLFRYTEDYAKGWNHCLGEMKDREDVWFQDMDKLFK